MVRANVFPKLQTEKILVRQLSKKCPFRKGFDRHHVKVSQILSKSPWQPIYHVISSFSGKLIVKMSPLVLSEISGVFFIHCLPMRSIVFSITRICDCQFKCNYLKNENPFLNFLFNFWNLHQIWNFLKKKMMVIANVFPKLQTVKNFFTPLCKKRRFGTRLDSPSVKVSQILAKSPWERFYHVF